MENFVGSLNKNLIHLELNLSINSLGEYEKNMYYLNESL